MAIPAGPPFLKTYSRPPDRWPDDQLFDEATQVQMGSSRFTRTYSGYEWKINHKLCAKSLLLDFWVDPLVTPNAKYLTVIQNDLNNITITWDSMAYGRVCIYRCLDTDYHSRVYQQTTPAYVWKFTHDLGTVALIADCWVDGKLVDSSHISVSEMEVTCTFTVPCTGLVCILLADPEINSQARIMWSQIIDKPDFGDHVHKTADEVLEARNALRLGGVAAADFLTRAMLGVSVAPLDEDTGRVPHEYLPNNSKVYMTDESETTKYVAQEIQIADVKSPLYLATHTTPTLRRAIIGMTPVIKRILLEGDILLPPGDEEKFVEASDSFVLRLIFGDNLSAMRVDRHTLALQARTLTIRDMSYPGTLNIGETWSIVNPYFNVPATHLITIYEKISDGTVKDFEFDPYDGNEFLAYTGAPLGYTDGSILRAKVRFDADHFWWEEQLNTSLFFNSWSELRDIFWNEPMMAFVVMDRMMGNYRFHTFDPITETTTLVRSGSETMLTGMIFLVQGQIIRAIDDGGCIQLVWGALLDLPVSVTWTVMCTFTASTYPTVPLEDIRFKCDGTFAYFLFLNDNHLEVYDIMNPANPPVFNQMLPDTATDIVTWPDHFVSFATGGVKSSVENAFWTTNLSIDTPGVIFIRGPELFAGYAKYLAHRCESTFTAFNRGVAIFEDGSTGRANLVSMANKRIYWVGTAEFWTLPNVGVYIGVSSQYAFNFNFNAMNLPPGVTVKIAFSFTPSFATPSTLLVWTPGGFVEHPRTSFPALAQDLSVLNDIRVSGDNSLYYVLFIESTDETVYWDIDLLLKYQTVEQGAYAPLLYNDYKVAGNSVTVTMVTGALFIENTTDRPLEDLRVVLLGGAIV